MARTSKAPASQCGQVKSPEWFRAVNSCCCHSLMLVPFCRQMRSCSDYRHGNQETLADTLGFLFFAPRRHRKVRPVTVSPLGTQQPSKQARFLVFHTTGWCPACRKTTTVWAFTRFPQPLERPWHASAVDGSRRRAYDETRSPIMAEHQRVSAIGCAKTPETAIRERRKETRCKALPFPVRLNWHSSSA